MNRELDWQTMKVLRLREAGDPILVRARKLMQEGLTHRAIAVELGWDARMVGRMVALENPRSALSLRVERLRKEKEEREQRKRQQVEQRRIARQVRGKVAELKRASYSEPVQYEQFLARERGETVPGARIPLLDYSEEDEQETEVHKKKAWRAEFRQRARALLPVDKRVEILVNLCKSDDPGVAMKALHELHSIEGAIKKPTPEVRGGGGPLFSIPGGLPIQVAPVGPATPPPTREDEQKPS